MSNPTTTLPFGMTPSDVIATSAALISLLAMAATFWQAKLARKHNALSVRPVLVFYNHLHEDKPIQLIVKNAGLGLALLKSISFSWSEHDYEHNADIFMNLAKVKEIYGVIPSQEISSIGGKTAMAPGDELVLYKFDDREDGEEGFKRICRLLDGIKIAVEYSCLYENNYDTACKIEGTKARTL